MRRLIAPIAVLALAACGGADDPVSDVGPQTTTAPADAGGNEVPTTDPSIVDASAVYRMVLGYLSQTLAASPALRERVTSVEELASCMVNAGYQLNGLPPPGAPSTQTTLVAPETMISPMLTYLTESCTGLPSSEWLGG